MEDNLNGRQPQWKTTSMEDNLNGRQPQWKMTSMEDNLNEVNRSSILFTGDLNNIYIS